MPENLEPLRLLRTKLHRPRPLGELVPRPRLNDVLERHLDRAATFVCAPAGYGKTIALALWLEQRPGLNAWLSLDSGDNDLAVFLSYLAAAVRTLFPTACADTLALLQAPIIPPVAALVNALGNDLDSLADEPELAAGKRFVLVLDDYHVIREPAIHTLMSELLQHPPRPVHLVFGARQDPPLLLHVLRGRGLLNEIRVSELRFTLAEAAIFTGQALETPLEPGELAALVDTTEGWGTGLRMAVLALNTGSDVSDALRTSASDNRFVLDFLLNEVLDRVPEATQQFLLQTSILDQLCGALCDAVACPCDAEWDGHSFLAWLAAQNLFTFSLDTDGTWYRYHHLFRKLLRRQLERRSNEEEIRQLHRRASDWFAQHGLTEEAIRHALQGGDESAAAGLVEVHRYDMMNREHWRQLENWLNLMPHRLIDARPELLLVQAWILQKQWRLPDLLPLLDRIEVLLDRASPLESNCEELRGELDVLRSIHLYYATAVERAAACAKRALECVPLEHSLARGTAWLYYIAGLQAAGQVQAVQDAILEGLKEDDLHRNAFATRLYVALCMSHWMNADMPHLMLGASQLLEMARQRNLTEATGWAHYFLGCALYQLDDLASAEVEFEQVMRQRYVVHGLAYSQSGFALASIFTARGEGEQARVTIDSIAAYALETGNKRVMVDAEAHRACLAQGRGAAAEAQRWAASFDPDTPLVPLTSFSIPHLLYARVLLASTTSSNRAKAVRVLAHLRDFASAAHSTRYLIEVLALQALLLDVQGKLGAALDTLEQAVGLAEPGGMIRVFVDLGPQMAVLIRQLTGRAPSAAPPPGPEYVQRLLAAFGNAKPAQPQPDSSGLIEPLTQRELDVLVLLSKRLIDKEIARELNISPMTVKRHASNIYQKLEVGGRREAVAKAVALGLLPASPPVHP